MANEAQDTPEVDEDEAGSSLGGRVRFIGRGGREIPASEAKPQMLRSDEVAELIASLEELQVGDVEKKAEALRARAPEDADSIAKAYKTLAYLRREVPDFEESGAGAFTEEVEAANRVIHAFEVKRLNPWALKLNNERRDRERENRRTDRIAWIKDRDQKVFDLATEGFTVHAASEGLDGSFPLRYRVVVRENGTICFKMRGNVYVLDGNGNRIPRTNPHVALITAKDGLGKITASTQPSLVERHGSREFPLLAPEFETPQGQPFWPDPIKEALVRKFKAEEADTHRNEMNAKRTISFTEGLAGKKGVGVAHFVNPRPYKSGNLIGPLSVVVEFPGRGMFVLRDVLSTRFEELLTPAIGEKLSIVEPEGGDPEALAKAAKELRTLFRRRTNYEAHQSAREASPEIAEEAEAPTAEEGDESAEETPSEA